MQGWGKTDRRQKKPMPATERLTEEAYARNHMCQNKCVKGDLCTSYETYVRDLQKRPAKKKRFAKDLHTLSHT